MPRSDWRSRTPAGCYPFFAPLLGWLGVALTGSDTSSNALFGSLQRITAEQLGLNPILIVASNSTGGVMGKMIDAQSIVVAAVATEQTGGEGRILRFRLFAQHRAGLTGRPAHASAGLRRSRYDSTPATPAVKAAHHRGRTMHACAQAGTRTPLAGGQYERC